MSRALFFGLSGLSAIALVCAHCLVTSYFQSTQSWRDEHRVLWTLGAYFSALYLLCTVPLAILCTLFFFLECPIAFPIALLALIVTQR
jgi:hypothetical protein